jgi:hypothetical protein
LADREAAAEHDKGHLRTLGWPARSSPVAAGAPVDVVTRSRKVRVGEQLGFPWATKGQLEGFAQEKIGPLWAILMG